MQLQFLLCFLFCLAANWTDHCTLRIPNKIILWSAASGLVVQIFLYGWTGVLQWAGGLLPAFVLLPFFALRMLGAGDIKLLSTLGGILGIKWGALLIVFSLLSSGLIGIIILIRYGIFVQRFRVLGEYFRSCFLSRTILSYEDANQPMNHDGKFAFSYGVTLGVLCITFIYYFYG